MIRHLGLVFILLTCLAADCHNGRQYELSYPATLTVVNLSASELEIQEIYTDPKSSYLFTTRGGNLAPRSQLEVRISEGVYETIRQGAFFIIVNCPGYGDRTLDGRDLQRRSIYDPGQWSVTVSIESCRDKADNE